MLLILALVHVALTVLLAAFTVRIVLDVTQSFAPRWRPRGPILVLASAVYAATDWVIRPLRRVIPPIGLGGVGLDVAFMVAYFAVVLARVLVQQLAFAL